MTDLRKAAEMAAFEVPLHELLEGVPESARLVIDSDDGMSTSFIPVGLYCKRAAKALHQALAMERFSEVSQEIEEALKQPKHEWVGLTDEEYDELMLSGDWGGSLIQAVEAKLKEKNT